MPKLDTRLLAWMRFAAWVLVALLVVVTLVPIGLRPVVTANPSIERIAAYALAGLVMMLGYPRHWLVILIGSVFVGIQFIEYRKLMFADAHSIGVSRNGHFRPDSSLFGSCFFTMTGFHGAHVTGGVIMLTIIWVRSLFGGYDRHHFSPVELAGLYWHFVDLVWIILFTVAYLI